MNFFHFVLWKSEIIILEVTSGIPGVTMSLSKSNQSKYILESMKKPEATPGHNVVIFIIDEASDEGESSLTSAFFLHSNTS